MKKRGERERELGRKREERERGERGSWGRERQLGREREREREGGVR